MLSSGEILPDKAGLMALLYYSGENCSDAVLSNIRQNFNTILEKLGACGKECRQDNIWVSCGTETSVRRKRSLEQAEELRFKRSTDDFNVTVELSLFIPVTKEEFANLSATEAWENVRLKLEAVTSSIKAEIQTTTNFYMKQLNLDFLENSYTILPPTIHCKVGLEPRNESFSCGKCIYLTLLIRLLFLENNK